MQIWHICALWKKFIYSTMIHQKMWYIEATINIFNIKLQKITLIFSFTWKSEKDSKMIMNPIFGYWPKKKKKIDGSKQIPKNCPIGM